MPRYRTFHHLEEYLVSNLPYRTYSISLEKAEPRSEEGVHKEGEETVIKLVDQEDLRKEREGKLALEEKKAGGQLHSNRLYIGLDENSVLTVVQITINHNKETFRLPSMFPLISYVFPCTEILKV